MLFGPSFLCTYVCAVCMTKHSQTIIGSYLGAWVLPLLLVTMLMPDMKLRNAVTKTACKHPHLLVKFKDLKN
jgi:hypothetical protein